MEQYKALKKPLPKWAADEPPVCRGGEFYIRAFWRLSTERQFGQGGVGPIPWSRTMDYATRSRLNSVMTEVFFCVIDEMDEAYRNWVAQDINESRARASRTGKKKAKW